MIPFHYASHSLHVDGALVSLTPTQYAIRAHQRERQWFKVAALTLPVWLFLPFVFDTLQGLWLLLPVLGFGAHVHFAAQQLHAFTHIGGFAMASHFEGGFSGCKRTAQIAPRKWWQRQRREITLDTQGTPYVIRLAPRCWALCLDHEELGDIVLAMAAHQPPLVKMSRALNHAMPQDTPPPN